MTNIYTFLKYGHTNAIKWSSSIRMVGQINAITQLSDAFHSDSSDAEKYAYEFASNSSNDILYDADSISNPPLRYWASKEVVTPESIKYFNQMRDKATSEKMDIYNSEKAKGTSDADILDMIFAYNDAQPEEYKKMSGWGY